MSVGSTKVIDNTISPELILMDVAGELLQRIVLLPAWLERLPVWLHRSLVRVDVASIYAWAPVWSGMTMVVVGVIGLLPLHMTKVFGVLLTVDVPTTDVNISRYEGGVSWRVEMSCGWRRHHLTFER